MGRAMLARATTDNVPIGRVMKAPDMKAPVLRDRAPTARAQASHMRPRITASRARPARTVLVVSRKVDPAANAIGTARSHRNF